MPLDKQKLRIFRGLLILRTDKILEKILEVVTQSEAETENLAKELAKKLVPGDFIAFFGDLGSGKTAFVRGLAEIFCPGIRVSSPTYAIVNEYSGNPYIFHFDMYRITDDDSLYSTGFYDYFDRKGIMAVEWCENISFAIPDKYYKIRFEKISETVRKITVLKH